MQQLIWSRESNKLLLFGELKQDMLNPLWDARQDVMNGVTHIDLSSIAKVDTAGVALLVHLIALGSKINGVKVTISHSHINENVLSLAKLYNLPADMLPR